MKKIKKIIREFITYDEVYHEGKLFSLVVFLLSMFIIGCFILGFIIL